MQCKHTAVKPSMDCRNFERVVAAKYFIEKPTSRVSALQSKNSANLCSRYATC